MSLGASIWMYLTWAINGFLVIIYLAVEHVATILLFGSAAAFVAYTPKEQRAWATGSSALAITSSLIGSFPVPLFLLVISLAGWAGQWLEQYNKPSQRWNTIRAQALYSLAGLGYTAYQNLGWANALTSDPSMAQGAGYINTILAIAMYVMPLGFLVMLAQSIWAHPPAPGKPHEIITAVRTRGKG